MSQTMKAMVLHPGRTRLTEERVSVPCAGPGELLIKVRACAVCRTDLHVLDGDLPNPKLPLIPGHEVIGTVEAVGDGTHGTLLGQRVGVPWLGATCGACPYCRTHRENLCDNAAFTGYTRDGGFAEYLVADHRYCFPIPDSYTDAAAAPLMCAGLIGFRSLKAAGTGKRLGLYGFGAAAHIIAQVAVKEDREIYAFTKSGDTETQEFARSLGAVWSGGSDDIPPVKLDAAIIFAPVGALVPIALRAVDKAGTVVCAGIHMSDIPTFPYDILWEERVVKSVANLTRADGEEFLRVAPTVPVTTTVQLYPLSAANDALDDLRHGRFEGTAVLTPQRHRLDDSVPLFDLRQRKSPSSLL